LAVGDLELAIGSNGANRQIIKSSALSTPVIPLGVGYGDVFTRYSSSLNM
jgi:hypothetical protein